MARRVGEHGDRRSLANPTAPCVGADNVRRMQLVPDEAYSGWEAVYRDNVERIYRLMFVKVGNQPDAEDLTAEVFLAALGPLRVTASVGEVRAYLLATARTVLAGYWRRTLGRPLTRIEDDYAEPEGAPDEPASDSPRRADAVLAALPAQYARILELRFLEGCSVRQAAAEMGVSVANAKVLQHRALRRAAQLCGEEQQR